MTHSAFNKILLTIGGAAASLFILSAAHAQVAAAPEFFITWRSGAYVEPAFQGKILPVAGAPLEVSAMLTDNGKIVDLSKLMIRWFRNGHLFQSGTGLQTVAMQSDPLLRDTEIRVKVVVAGYKNTDREANITLQPARPEVVIRPAYPGWLVPAGNASFRALFYHWNIADPEQLLLRWSLQGQTMTSSGGNATLAAAIPDAAVGSALTLQLAATSAVSDLESASTQAQLLITH